MSITGLSQSQLDNYRREAERLVDRYDTNGDRRISRHEAERQRVLGTDSYSFTTRISDDWVNRTTVYQEERAELRYDAVRDADRNGDDQLDAREIVDAYLRKSDDNHNGDLSWWEKLGMSVSGMVGMIERRWSVEIDRRTRMEYDPRPDYDRPTPPRPDYDRPTPPRPDYDRPTPPRPDYDRPTPPRPDNSRPTPPRPDYDRPTPPRPDNSRPTPPSSGDRPRPPRP